MENMSLQELNRSRREKYSNIVTALHVMTCEVGMILNYLSEKWISCLESAINFLVQISSEGVDVSTNLGINAKVKIISPNKKAASSLRENPELRLGVDVTCYSASLLF